MTNMTEESKKKIDIRKIQTVAIPKYVRLMWCCKHPDHEMILAFQTRTEAKIHEQETGHRTSFERIEFDEPQTPQEKGIL